MKYRRVSNWVGSSVITEDGKYIIERASHGTYFIRDTASKERLIDREGFTLGFSKLKDAKAHLERMYQ